MLADVIWGAFEKTGDVKYYLEYKWYKHFTGEMQSQEEEEKMGKTG